jgi:glycerol uptake facilitator-like aquaporin
MKIKVRLVKFARFARIVGIGFVILTGAGVGAGIALLSMNPRPGRVPSWAFITGMVVICLMYGLPVVFVIAAVSPLIENWRRGQ